MNAGRGPPDFLRLLRQVLNAAGSSRRPSGSSPNSGTSLKALFGGSGAIVGLGCLAYGINTSIYNVDGGHRAVKYSRWSGVLPQVFEEGTHLMIPWLETPIIYDVRAKPRNITSLSGTKDLQMVNMTLRVLSRPNMRELPTIHKTLGQDFDERVLPSIVNEVLKSVVAQFNASQLITQREAVSRLVRTALQERARKFNIILDDVSLTHVKFSPDFTIAVEAKQIAQQDAQRAAYVVERAKQEKASIIIKAEGEAKSAALIGEAVQNNPGFMTLRRMEAAREIASVMQRSGNKVYLSSDTLLLNVSDRLLFLNPYWKRSAE